MAIEAVYERHGVEVQSLRDTMTFHGDRPTSEEFIFQVAMMPDAYAKTDCSI